MGGYKYRIVNEHPLKIFENTAFVPELPDLPKKLLAEQVTFKETRSSWAASGGVFPESYEGAFIEPSSKACAQCHDTVGKHAFDFDMGRDWYGRVRGSDGIFSFHIFEPSSISYGRVGGQPIIRNDLPISRFED